MCSSSSSSCSFCVELGAAEEVAAAGVGEPTTWGAGVPNNALAVVLEGSVSDDD
jgi:hypothetical protein